MGGRSAPRYARKLCAEQHLKQSVFFKLAQLRPLQRGGGLWTLTQRLGASLDEADPWRPYLMVFRHWEAIMAASRFREKFRNLLHGLRIAVKTVTSRLGLEIYALAALPVAFLAALALYGIDQTLSRRAADDLSRSLSVYRNSVQDRLLSVAELVYQLGRQRDGEQSELTSSLTDHAILDHSGVRLSGTFYVPIDVSEFLEGPETPRLVMDSTGPETDLYLVQKVADNLSVGLVSPDYLWADPSLVPFATDVCVSAPGYRAALACPMDVSVRVQAMLARSGATSGWLLPEAGDQDEARFYWKGLASAAIETPPFSIVASPHAPGATTALSEIRSFLKIVLVAMLTLALLAAGGLAWRTLNAVDQLASVAIAYSKGNFGARAHFKLKRRDELSRLIEKLHLMADRLSQQLSAREALSQIDQIILSGTEIQETVNLVLKSIVEGVRCQRVTGFLIDGESDGRAIKTEISNGHPVPRYSELELSEKSVQWLQAHRSGVLVSDPTSAAIATPFIAADAKLSFVLPVMANGVPAGVVSIIMKDGCTLDDVEMNHIHVLAGRLAVALESVAKSAELHRKAYFDDLTGLPNRDFCFNRLDQALKQANHVRGNVAVMFVDLDGFKAVNDSLGHIAGDDLIRQAAYRLSGCVGESGTVGRLGGDEFGIVLPFPVNEADPDKIASKVLTEMRKPFMIGTSEIHVSASIGVAQFPEDGGSRVELLRKADTAMYRAKESGRGQSANYSQTMGIKVDRRMQLEGELRYALERDEFQVYYQPQVNMRTGRVISAEALLRWNHPEKGLVSPADFIPIAEDTGYINVIGAWVMSTACRDLAKWQSAGLGINRIAVNVSAGQFRRHDFINTVESCLLNLNFKRGALELELTESVFVEDLTQAKSTLDRLKSTGVSISIDDFGTGYSSLGYLKHLTFDIVKVDQSFVHELPRDKTSAAIVHAVVAMTHTLGAEVVAEGVEDMSQFNYLRDAGVDIAQGFHIGRPMTPEDFSQWLKSVEQNAELFERFKWAHSR